MNEAPSSVATLLYEKEGLCVLVFDIIIDFILAPILFLEPCHDPVLFLIPRDFADLDIEEGRTNVLDFLELASAGRSFSKSAWRMKQVSPQSLLFLVVVSVEF